MKVKSVAAMKRLLEKRTAEIGKVRDRLREDISELESLADTCDSAIESMRQAAEYLSEMA